MKNALHLSKGSVYAAFIVLFIGLYSSLSAQVSYTANEQVTAYDGIFRFGMNLGYYPGWPDYRLGDLSSGNPERDLIGVGVNSGRPSLYEYILEDWGYDSRLYSYERWAEAGMTDHTVIVGGPAYAHRDHTKYCEPHESKLFANLYDDIWDNGENGTPVNDNNYFALYLYKIATMYGDYIKIWEIWNEPDFDRSGLHWYYEDTNSSWWVNDPDPCDYQLRAPVQHYVRVLRVAWEVLKTVQPDSYVSIGALGYPHFLDAVLRNTDNPVDGSVSPEFPLGGGAYFDVMSYHIYPHIDGTLWDYDRPNNDITAFHRHSDRAVDNGIVRKKIEFEELLFEYGYDGNTYPEKIWNITESGVPRQVFDEYRYYGSTEMQINYTIKSVVAAQKLEVIQLHVYKLADDRRPEEATSEFHTMGMYKKILDVDIEDVEVNEVGIAYKTTSDLLMGLKYDANQTAALNMSSDIDGGAFVDDNGDYVYVLWAKTSIDKSESANANYTFPSSFDLGSLDKRTWQFAETGNVQNISSQSIALTGEPIFLSAANGTVQPSADVDLSLKLDVDDNTLVAYQHRNYTLTLINDGTATAHEIEVDFSLPEGLVFSGKELTQGTYSDWSGKWRVGELGANSTAVLKLDLYTLTDEGPIISYAQVVKMAETDADSSPANGVCCEANEDDEVAISIGEGSIVQPPNPGEGVDLELTLLADRETYQIYDYVTWQLKVQNTGNARATGLKVAFPLPEGTAFSNKMVFNGTYSDWSGNWRIDELEAGETAVMDLRVFTLVDGQAIEAYGQVIALDQEDMDSTPDNGICCSTSEDDEVVLTVMPTNGIQSNPTTISLNQVSEHRPIVIHRLFPNPAMENIQVYFSAKADQVDMNIYNSQTQLVKKVPLQETTGFNRQEVDISDLPTGVYYLWMEGQTGKQPMRFVKIAD